MRQETNSETTLLAQPVDLERASMRKEGLASND